jgi:excisionase family DNA binding protein
MSSEEKEDHEGDGDRSSMYDAIVEGRPDAKVIEVKSSSRIGQNRDSPPSARNDEDALIEWMREFISDAEKTSDTPTWDDLPVVCNVDDLAPVLGVNRDTLYEMINRDELPGVRRVGRRIRISRDRVREWLEGGE